MILKCFSKILFVKKLLKQRISSIRNKRIESETKSAAKTKTSEKSIDYSGILFAFVFPLVQVTLFFYAIGRDPKGIVVAVVNDEAGHCDHGNIIGSVIHNPEAGTCDYIDISCRFLHGFNSTIMEKVFFFPIFI